MPLLAGTTALWTSLPGASGSGAAAPAVGARDQVFEFDGLLDSGGDLLQFQFQAHLQISTLTWSSPPRPGGCAEEVVKPSEASEVPHKSPQGIGEIESLESPETFESTEAGGTGMSELVVLASLLGVLQNLVGLGGLLELLLRPLISGVFVGMVFQRQLAIGFLYIIYGGVAVDS